MSLGSDIAKDFKAAESWVAGLFKKATDEFENVLLPAAIGVTNTLKTITELDSTDIIGKLAGSAGAALEDKVRAALIKIIPALQLAQQWKGQDPNTILTNVLKQIGDATGNTKTAFYVEFSGMVATDFASGNLSIGEAYQLAQYFYKNNSTPGTGTSASSTSTSGSAPATQG